jgi:hypothetical protein
MGCTISTHPNQGAMWNKSGGLKGLNGHSGRDFD